jgi:hypothetical protein
MTYDLFIASLPADVSIKFQDGTLCPLSVWRNHLEIHGALYNVMAGCEVTLVWP